MSEALPMDQLRSESASFGNHPYLLTQGGDGRPHAVVVSIEWQGDRILTNAGTRSSANVAARSLLSLLLWPPIEAGGYSLIVDGDGHVIGSGSDARISVTPTRGACCIGPAYRRPPRRAGAARTASPCSAEVRIMLGRNRGAVLV